MTILIRMSDMNDLQKHLVQLVRDAVNQHWRSWTEKSISFKVCSRCRGILGMAYVEQRGQYEVCALCSPQEKQRIEVVWMDVLEAIYLHACAGWVPLVLRDWDVHPPADCAWEKVYCVFQPLAAQVGRETGMTRTSVIIDICDDDEHRVCVAVCGRWGRSEETYLLLAGEWCHWTFTWDSLEEMAASLEAWYHAMKKKARLANTMHFLQGYTPEQLEGAAITVEDRLRDYTQWLQGEGEARDEAEWRESFDGEGEREYYVGFGDDLSRAFTILSHLAKTLSQ